MAASVVAIAGSIAPAAGGATTRAGTRHLHARRRCSRPNAHARPLILDIPSLLRLNRSLRGRLAQLAEHLLDKQGVTGSSPVSPTMISQPPRSPAPAARAATTAARRTETLMPMATAPEDRPEVVKYPGGEALYRLRHSTAHVLATAVTELFPDVKVAGGPPIENGFYYDFARDTPFTPDDLERIEARMREIVSENQPFEYVET